MDGRGRAEKEKNGRGRKKGAAGSVRRIDSL